MFDPVQDIADFHEKFGLAYKGSPRSLPEELQKFRINFMYEELLEYETAPAKTSKELDALVDLVYVVLGTAHLHGYNFREAWRRIHDANMKKVRGNAGDPRSTRGGSTYDVVKPEGWEAPNLDDLV